MMKKIVYSLLIAGATFAACDPIEDRDSLSGSITVAELDISATPLVVDGVNSNKIILKNNSPVLSQWDYGLGVSLKAADTILMVVPGTQTISFTGLNGDGSEITKELSVTVDELTFEVPAQWEYLCGTGEKKWVWDESLGKIWGNGGYRGSVKPDWWGRTLADIEEETAYAGWDANSFMTFSITDGAVFSKSNSTGTKIETGSFQFDMSDTILYNGGADVWASGELKITGTTILQGISQNDGKVTVYTFDIIKLSADQMVLAYKTRSGDNGSNWGEWGGEAWFWVFKPEE